MPRGLRRWLRALRRRLPRLGDRRLHAGRQWLEQTSNLLHVSIITLIPLLMAVVTYLSNVVTAVSFLLFPPLASGTYTLFADPEGRYSSPTVFVGGMTAGALCGWLALESSAMLAISPGSSGVSAVGAAGAMFLTGLVTWALDLEEPTSFSTALLVLLTGGDRLLYVAGIALSSTIVAVVFYVWREEFYEERARYLYGTTQADDHVLVPMRDAHRDATTAFGAQLAAAHDAGKVVLLDIVPDETLAEAEADVLAAGTAETKEEARAVAEAQAAADAAVELQARAERVRERFEVPCEVVVVAGDPDDASVVRETAASENCDLIVTGMETTDGGNPSPYIRGLLEGGIDAVAFRSRSSARSWDHPLVTVGREGAVAHAMVDYAQRLAGVGGTISICTCIGAENDRREAESMLASLAETTTYSAQTMVARSDVVSFLERTQRGHDLVFVGASSDRSRASRFLSVPTYERLEHLEVDIAIVHRA